MITTHSLSIVNPLLSQLDQFKVVLSSDTVEVNYLCRTLSINNGKINTFSVLILPVAVR